MATCNASSLLAANPFTRLDKGLQEACKLQLLCDISAGGGGGTIGGSGTAGALAKFTAATTLGDSIVTESGSTLSVAGGITQTGQLVINRGALTGAASPSIDITGTWNNAATTFTSIRLNMTDTASASGSLLMDLQVASTSAFRVRKDSSVFLNNSTNPVFFLRSDVQLLQFHTSLPTTTGVAIGPSTFNPGVILASAAALRWTNDTQAATVDIVLVRDAAGALAQRNGVNGQSLRVYNTYTSSTSYERGVFDWQTTANTLRIGTEKGSGGGTARDAVLVTDATERVRVDINGNVVVNTAAIATNATNGFLYVPSCAGTPTGTPTTFTGRVPIVVDTTNNKLYFYSGAAWRDAGP